MKVILLLLSLLFSVGGNTQIEKEMPVSEISGNEKVLIVYLTRTKNTQAVAEIIQDKLGGKLVALEKQDPYPQNYQEIVAQVDSENEQDYLPVLKTKIEDLGDYDIVFVGFPTWDIQMPPPMKSFLTENDLSGKTLIPFNTNAGYGVGRGFDQLREICPNSKILEGFSVEGGYEKKGVLLAIKGERKERVEDQVVTWLTKIGLLEKS
ncbi:flavodoxin [Zunongwangia sp. F260]|uniref:Flavodoxin n=1 Tax=Autumnicola lenta TaxID=3075593 RepID=A0ABU3CMQ4_9FLAO|nr:flavodoxin [Zunongwangia sp. F260]MDT0647624.1 flavodoxin [Zunongwangia sp. F260]